MDKTIHSMKAAVAAAIGLLTGLWGWLGWLAAGWIAAMALDYLTGSLAAARAGAWSSGKARDGIWHKCGMVVVVAVAAGTDLLLSLVLANLPLAALPVEYAGLVCPVVLVWYIVTELGSMAENAAAMGAPVPKWLVKLLAMSKGAVDGAGDKLGGGEHE